MSESPADRVPGTDSSSGVTGGGPVMAGLTPLAQQYLDQTRPWVRFMSVVTFVSAGLMVLLGLLMLLLSATWSRATNTGELGVLGNVIGGGVMALVYLALACVYIAPALYLSRYATAIQRLKVNATAGGLEDALKHQRCFWRYVGILTVIGVAVAVIGVGLAIIAGVIAWTMAARP